ncbi:hypothetical protein [Rickettsia endosymbiont of Nabis limbatus]|uniref:hypothetical protein n=1 Tax=Rickettsia endosymbiont of Nabis limbatus TaxID=3066268 RepID=UPI003AF39B4C
MDRYLVALLRGVSFKKFISDIILDATSSDSKIIGNLNTLICETARIIKGGDVITEQSNVIISGEVSEKIHDSDSLWDCCEMRG